MSSNKRKFLRTIFTANGGCGCGKPKQGDVFEPEPKSTIHQNPSNNFHHRHHSSSSSWEKTGEDEDHTSISTTTFNVDADGTSPHCSPNPNPKISNSVAVVKDSNDPYLDFRQSMLQMILERDIRSKDDLQALLNCFLRLNAPAHHEMIVRAFMEIWNSGVVSGTTRPST